MSRIWDESKRAETQRSENSFERRKARRSRHRVALLVYGSDINSNPFHEVAETVDADESGCLVLMEARILRGQRLFIVNTANQDELECRVVRVGKLIHDKSQVALKFLRAAPEFWFDS